MARREAMKKSRFTEEQITYVLRQADAGTPVSDQPSDNGLFESFNGRLRDECLNVNEFASLDAARQRIEAWRTITTITDFASRDLLGCKALGTSKETYAFTAKGARLPRCTAAPSLSPTAAACASPSARSISAPCSPTERRRKAGRRAHLARDLHAVRLGILR
jgi:hypothetical protein